MWATRAAPSEDGAACSPIWSCSRRGLPCHRVLPPARCALTAPFHPYRPLCRAGLGGLLSVALSVGSRPPGVTWRLALGARTFLHACAQRLSGRLRRGWCVAGRCSRLLRSASRTCRRSICMRALAYRSLRLPPREVRGDLRGLRRRQFFAAARAAAASASSSSAALAARRAADDDHDLAARHVAVVLGSFAQLRERAAVRRFETLRELATDRRAALRAECRAPYRAALPRADAALRRRSACALRSRAARGARARAAVFAGKKPSKTKRSVGRPATDSAAIAAHGPGIATTAMPLRARGGDQIEARIADQRRARVARPARSIRPRASRATSSALFCASLCSCSDVSAVSMPQALQQLPGVPRIFRRDQRDARQHLAGARR